MFRLNRSSEVTVSCAHGGARIQHEANPRGPSCSVRSCWAACGADRWEDEKWTPAQRVIRGDGSHSRVNPCRGTPARASPGIHHEPLRSPRRRGTKPGRRAGGACNSDEAVRTPFLTIAHRLAKFTQQTAHHRGTHPPPPSTAPQTAFLAEVREIERFDVPTTIRPVEHSYACPNVGGGRGGPSDHLAHQLRIALPRV